MVPKVCSVEDCERTVRARGFCGRHYQQLKAAGDPRVALLPPKPKYCTVDGCDRKVHGNGLCGAHWNRVARHGSVDGGGPDRQPLDDWCSKPGCENAAKARNLCSGHWKAWRAEGDPEYRDKRRAEWWRWAEQNKTHLSSYAKEYRAENRDQLMEILEAWKIENPGASSLHGYIRRRRLYDLPVLIIDVVDPGVVYENCDGICGICGVHVDLTLAYDDPMSQNIDHIIPVADPASMHSYANTQLAHRTCNQKKSSGDTPRELRALASLE